jgi:hypothetical protein
MQLILSWVRPAHPDRGRVDPEDDDGRQHKPVLVRDLQSYLFPCPYQVRTIPNHLCGTHHGEMPRGIKTGQLLAKIIRVMNRTSKVEEVALASNASAAGKAHAATLVVAIGRRTPLPNGGFCANADIRPAAGVSACR